MATLSANAPDNVLSGAAFNVGAVLSGGPPNSAVDFVLEHHVGPGAVPAWAPMVITTVTSGSGAAAVSFNGVLLTAVGAHGLFCYTRDVAGPFASDAEAVLVQ